MDKNPTTERAPEVSGQPSGGTRVELRALDVEIGGTPLLRNAKAVFPPGKITLIVGPSGAGKSVLLRVLAGLDRHGGPITADGVIQFGGTNLSGTNKPRPVGVVFQSFALFDELSSLENVQFAAAHRANRDTPSHESLEPKKLLSELRVPRGVRTAQLSGGQRQRLAIARTLSYNPDVVLYDEPTSGLDAATAAQVAELICATHETHPRTSVIVTHDYESLSAIADTIYLFDPTTQSLNLIEPEDWPRLRELLHPVTMHADEIIGDSEDAAGQGSSASELEDEFGEQQRSGIDERQPNESKTAKLEQAEVASGSFLIRTARNYAKRAATGIGDFLAGTTKAAEAALRLPFSLLPVWKSARWGGRYFLHYLRLVADPSAWLYIAISGLIIGFVGTYFTYKFLPYRGITEPILNENLLDSLGFALYRILVPVLATILLAARCGAAVSSDIGGKVYGQQFDALRSFGVSPPRYLLTGTLWAFLLGGPLLVGISYFVAQFTSLVVFTATQPELGPHFWRLNFHKSLLVPGQWFYSGTAWLAAKVLLCSLGVGAIAYYRGATPKFSTRDVSRGVTSTILLATLFVLTVHFVFAFFEFE